MSSRSGVARRARRGLVVALLLGAWARGDAQSAAEGAPAAGPVVQESDVVRFRPLESGRPAERWCTGRVSTVVGDTIVMARATECQGNAFTPAEVAALEVRRGHRGSRAKHFGLGLLAGGVVGGAAGALSARDCDGDCDYYGLATAVGAAAGFLAGAVAGGVVGLLLPAGPRWVSTADPHPIRIGGLNLRPAIRVARSRPRA